MGYDLQADLGSERLTFRRLLKVILPNLPRDSAFKQAVNPVDSLWSRTEYLLADAIDYLAAANWQRANAGSEHPSDRPDPYPRPADLVKATPAGQQSEKDARLAAHLAQRDRALARKAAQGEATATN